MSDRWPNRGNGGVYGDFPEGCGEPLTAEEVAALPHGAEVVIGWSGGNGPHRYFIHREAGLVYARSPHEGDHFSTAWGDPIAFVGAAPPFTIVRGLAPPNPESR
jgi:hypothetical protein